MQLAFTWVRLHAVRHRSRSPTENQNQRVTFLCNLSVAFTWQLYNEAKRLVGVWFSKSLSHDYIYLIWTPIPYSHNSNLKHHSRPGQVTTACISQQAEGIVAWSVTFAGDVVTLRIHGGEVTRDSIPLFFQQGIVASNLSKSWKWIFKE